MKYICRICIKQITDFNLVVLKPDELVQIKMQLSICIPEMDVGLVKDPVYCKSCASALHSAYDFKNQCLQTEEHILNYSRKILSGTCIDVMDLLYDLQQSTRNSVSEDNREGEKTKKEDFMVTPNMHLLLSDEVLVNGHNLNTESNTGQHSVTLPVDVSNKINTANKVRTNSFSKSVRQTTTNELNTLLHDPLRITPIQFRVFKQENENEDITIKEEDIASLKVESSLSYEGFENNLYERAEGEDHTAEVKSMNNESAILQANIVTQNCFVKLTRLPDDILYKYNGQLYDVLRNTSNRALVFRHEGEHKLVLKTQQKIHSSEKPFSCASCKFRTNFKQSLIYHTRIHTGEKPFACNVCTYRSACKLSLQKHLRIHSGEKPFACNVCPYRSAQKSNLQQHIRIHTGEKPFPCNVCTYRSATRSSLQEHIRIHTGAKPFSCNVCDFRSARKYDLKEHLRIHTGEKPFACNVCNFRSARKKCLQEHLRIHTGEKPFSCNLCNSTFSHENSFIYHRKKASQPYPY